MAAGAQHPFEEPCIWLMPGGETGPMARWIMVSDVDPLSPRLVGSPGRRVRASACEAATTAHVASLDHRTFVALMEADKWPGLHPGSRIEVVGAGRLRRIAGDPQPAGPNVRDRCPIEIPVR